MNNFGWSYPPGVSDNDIDEHFADGEDAILETYQEWAEEAHQEMTLMFTHITSMVGRNVIKNEDAEFLMRHLMTAQNWLENITGSQGKKTDEHQKE